MSFSFLSEVVTVHLLLRCHYFAAYISIRHQSLIGRECHISCEGVKFVSFSFLTEVVTVHVLLLNQGLQEFHQLLWNSTECSLNPMTVQSIF